MKKNLVIIGLVFGSVAVALKGAVPAWTNLHSDFCNYYVSAKIVAAGGPLDKMYDNVWFQQKINELGIPVAGKFSPFPPITAWMMLPLTPFDPLTAQRIFLLVNLGCLGMGVVLVRRFLSWPTEQCALLILSGGLGIINNVAFGQVYLIMAVSLLAAIRFANQGKIITAAILLAAFTAIKYFPITLIVSYFLIGLTKLKRPILKNVWKTPELQIVTWSAATVCLLIALQIVFFGSDLMSQFVRAVLLPHLDGELSGQGLYSFHYQSWDNLFRNLFIADPLSNPHPFLPWPAGRPILKASVELLVLTSGLYMLFRHRTSPERLRWTVYIVVPALAALVILPASATYHFALLLVPLVVVLSSGGASQKEMGLLIALFSLIGFIPYSIVFKWGAEWSIFLGYPRLWLITVFYLTTLFIFRPRPVLAFPETK